MGEEKRRFFLDQDNDGHWFVVPVSKYVRWEEWLSLDSEDERAWDVPEYITPIDGGPQGVCFPSYEIM